MSTSPPLRCEVCKKPITVMCFRGTGVCSGICQDAREAAPKPKKTPRSATRRTATKRPSRAKSQD